VRGWVLNRADGSVEVVVEGEPAAVESLVVWARRGPRHAVVSRVEVTEETPQGLRDFQIEG